MTQEAGMTHERIIRRYTAYYRGWCQAFGEHEIDGHDKRDVRWLYGEGGIGMIITSQLRKTVFKELLSRHAENPIMTLSESCVWLGKIKHPITDEWDRNGLKRLLELLSRVGDVHMYLTYHLFYPPGTRIMTFSHHPPFPIMYKEVGPMKVRIV